MLSKVWSIEDIKKELNIISKKMGVKCDNLEVIISNRMVAAKGKYRWKRVDGKIEGVHFKFASILLDGRYDEKVVREVIIHEYIHHYTSVTTNQNHGHDKLFKANCVKAGISPETYFRAKPVDDSLTIERNRREYKYLVICNDCGSTFKRKVLKNNFVENYRCSHCKGKFTVEKIK